MVGNTPEGRPLEGIKVAEFAWGIAGPVAGAQLAHYGATVVKVESMVRLDAIRLSSPYLDGKPGPDRSASFAYFNADKLSMSLNFKQAEGLRLARRLIGWADVVIESFRPGVMQKWGLGYEDIVTFKPDIIMLSSSSLGQTGPYARQPGLGNHLNAFTGLVNFIGFPDQEPENLSTAFTDYVPGPYLGASAILGALEYRSKTGKGQWLDLSQFETGLQGLGPALLDYSVNGRNTRRAGNTSRWAAPHNAYPCAGEDRWCAIEVSTDAQWAALCGAMGKPELISCDTYGTFLARKRSESALDCLIGEWTRTLPAEDLMRTLQAVGVPAGVVQSPGEIFQDTQLRGRDFFWQLKHPVLGAYDHLGATSRLSRTPATGIRPAPCYGEHTEYVCCELLGMSDEQFVEALQGGAFEDPR